MKVLKKVLAGVGIVLVVLIVVVVLFLGQVVKTAIETVGPQVAGVEMTLDKASINLLAGDVKIKGLVIGNPEGFKTPSLMELSQFVVDLDMGSLFTDTIVIKQIHIDGPQITYERGLRASNLSALQDNLASDEEADPAEEPEEKPAKKKSDKPAKKVVIEDFLFENGKVNVSITLAGGKQMTVPLAPIHLENIGKDSGGASITEIVNEVIGAITKSVGQAVAASGDLAGDALKGAGDLTADAAKGVTDAATSATKGATDAAAGAAKGATDAAAGAAKSLKKLGGGLFGGKE